ncbi:MAG: low specificity L-threonine aldolase [Lachnospiraceae bacterium]|nr:low specificity L-threonine aldolase [Lachnospiraceae bacterium]
METMEKKLPFACDYMQGGHPKVMETLMETNHLSTDGYGLDPFCEDAKKRILNACDCNGGDVAFFLGGTQANATMIHALLSSYQGVVCADTGHINVHEAGAVEFGGNKVLPLPHENGKLMPHTLADYLDRFFSDETYQHMVIPGMVYLTQPTELGTLYSLDELKQIRSICDTYHLPLYVDGARLAYALASPENTISLKDLAKYTDVFYIGGTKCGALFGEAVVLPNPKKIPYLFTIIKQHGALLAKGRLLGLQFKELFTDKLYYKCGETAIKSAIRIQDTLKELGYPLYQESATNQLFFVMEDAALLEFGNLVNYGFWEKIDAQHTVIRLVTSWYTKEEDVDKLIELLKTYKRSNECHRI